MESLNSKPPKKSEKTKAEATERLTLQKPEQEKLERWVQELNTRFDGMIRVTKSDLANFLIRLHPDSLSDSETAQIEHEHFDEVRWINWALNKIRAAKKCPIPRSLTGFKGGKSHVIGPALGEVNPT